MTYQAEIVDWTSAIEKVCAWKGSGLKVGFTNGCFDLLHAGHVHFLNRARMQCDRLIVALNYDKSVRILKGPLRPIYDEQTRATLVSSLRAVDLAVFFGTGEMDKDNTACELISLLRPNVYFKGGDYSLKELPEAKIVQSYSGKVTILNRTEGFSTTSTVEKIRSYKTSS